MRVFVDAHIERQFALPRFQCRAGYHGVGGELTVSKAKYTTFVRDAFLKAGKELGYDAVDYNGPHQTGEPADAWTCTSDRDAP